MVKKGDSADHYRKLSTVRVRTDSSLTVEGMVLNVSLLGGEVEVLVVLALSKVCGTQPGSNNIVTKGYYRQLLSRLIGIHPRICCPFLTVIIPLETQEAELGKAAYIFL